MCVCVCAPNAVPIGRTYRCILCFSHIVTNLRTRAGLIARISAPHTLNSRASARTDRQHTTAAHKATNGMQYIHVEPVSGPLNFNKCVCVCVKRWQRHHVVRRAKLCPPYAHEQHVRFRTQTYTQTTWNNILLFNIRTYQVPGPPYPSTCFAFQRVSSRNRRVIFIMLNLHIQFYITL